MPRFMFCWRFIAIWLSVGVCHGPAVGARAKTVASEKEGLYTKQDDVIILNKKNIKDHVYGKSTAWVIEFYNSWCGHCIHFAPTWRQFASDLKGWRRVVSVGAVDCASDENLEVCREYDIQAYPSVKLIPPNFNGNMVKGRVTKLDTQDKLEMKYAVLEYVTDAQFPVPPSWPRLKPLKTLGDIWEEANDDHKFVVVIFEDENSVVGREVILDLLDYPSVLVRTMLKKDVKKFGILKYPSLYIINKDSSFQHLASGTGMVDSDRHRFVDKLLSMMGFFDSQGRRIKIPTHPDGVTTGDRGEVVRFQQPKDKKPAKEQAAKPQMAEEGDRQTVSMGVHMQDLESALHYTLRQEIAICRTIEGSRLDALRNFVSALAKYFPGRKEVSRFLWKVMDYLREVEKPLTGESWMQAIDSLQDKEAFLPYQVRWVGCQGSHPRYRGYPCSMWTLFHTLTVAAYEKTGAVNALEVPLAIRGYMKHFFGCHECAQNFQKMATTLEQEIHKPLDAVMWLWAAHNKANKRLHGDTSEDPYYPKIQFPSAQDCPKCRLEQSADSFQVQQWNSSAVALFLLKVYSKDGLIQDATGTTGEVMGSRTDSKDEMDWWEKQQRQVDLKKIREFREQKKRRRQGTNALEEVAAQQQVGGAGEGRRPAPRADYKLEEGGPKFRLLHNSWGLSQLDIGVCMVFYVICAAIIVVLYYHFIVQKRFKMPCSNYLPV